MFRGSTSMFDKLLEKATSNLRLEPDWPAILQICDLIRQGDCPPKYALAGIKKKLYNQNPHIAMYSLLVLESLVKNCGHVVHDEVCTKAYMEQLRDFIKSSPHTDAKNKLLEMIQAWAYAFRTNSKYRAVQDIVNIMKTEGCKFPALKESDAMFSADSAPEWVDDSVCHRCRVSFSVVVRKHHCRACGNVFCGQCSSKQSTIPRFGIEKEVRVCDTCYEQLNTPRSASPHSKSETETLPAEYLSSSLAQQNQAPKPKGKTMEELKEEEELQLALALSQSEAEAKEKEKKKSTAIGSSASYAQTRPKSPQTATVVNENEADDPELARYLNRSYWEQKQTVADDSSNKQGKKETIKRVSPGGPPSAPTTPTHILSNGEVNPEMDKFVSALRGQVEVFVNRMKSNSSRGRSIVTDSSIQTLFMNVATNHSQLLKYIHQQDDMRAYYEILQEKLVQVKDARAALDALREEHRERLRREAEEAERQKQLQMAQKLQIMRKKKQEYLQYQRQLALQKVQEQEREMQMRQEQQKQHYMMYHGQYMQQWNDPAPVYGPYPPPAPQPHLAATGSSSYVSPPYNLQHQVPPGQQPGMPPQMLPPPGQQPGLPPQMLPPPGYPMPPVSGSNMMLQQGHRMPGPPPGPGQPMLPPGYPGMSIPGQLPVQPPQQQQIPGQQQGAGPMGGPVPLQQQMSGPAIHGQQQMTGPMPAHQQIPGQQMQMPGMPPPQQQQQPGQQMGQYPQPPPQQQQQQQQQPQQPENQGQGQSGTGELIRFD